MKVRALAAHAQRFVMAAILCAFVSGADMESPRHRHAAILARIMSYELTLEERAGESVGIAIVYRPGDAVSKTNADDWQRAFQELAPINVKGRPLVADLVPSEPSELHAAIGKGADVLLVTEGLDTELSTIARVARARHVLTAADSPSYVQTDLTVCVNDENGKTKITINLGAANLEHVQFGSRLLALATLIR
jgi:YfiR/HmsC-like